MLRSSWWLSLGFGLRLLRCPRGCSRLQGCSLFSEVCIVALPVSRVAQNLVGLVDPPEHNSSHLLALRVVKNLVCVELYSLQPIGSLDLLCGGLLVDLEPLIERLVFFRACQLQVQVGLSSFLCEPPLFCFFRCELHPPPCLLALYTKPLCAKPLSILLLQEAPPGQLIYFQVQTLGGLVLLSRRGGLCVLGLQA